MQPVIAKQNPNSKPFLSKHTLTICVCKDFIAKSKYNSMDVTPNLGCEYLGATEAGWHLGSLIISYVKVQWVDSPNPELKCKTGKSEEYRR